MDWIGDGEGAKFLEYALVVDIWQGPKYIFNISIEAALLVKKSFSSFLKRLVIFWGQTYQ